MILSRTASSKDLDYLNVQNNIISFLQHPSSIEDYGVSIYKFWEYSLVSELIKNYDVAPCNLLNVYRNKKDNPLESIINNPKVNITQIGLRQFFGIPIKNHKYDIVSAFGIFDNVSNEYKLLDKVRKHVAIDGYLILTTNNTKPYRISQDDLISFSFFLEESGYDFCSDEDELVDYKESSGLHSLVMKRVGQ